MSRRLVVCQGFSPFAVLTAALALLVGVAEASGQSAGRVPRTPEGRPDFQGNWTNATLTPFQREEGRGPVYTPEEVAQLESVEEECPPNPGTVACGRRQSGAATDEARLTGNEYNEIYWDRGTLVARVNGEPRTSLVTRPVNGRIPALTAVAQARVSDAQAVRAQFVQYDHPELRPLGERCFVFGRGVAPPMSPNGAYNNNYTIVQTPDHLVVMSEMVHDVRVIPIGEPKTMPSDLRPWFGNSWGRWEGDVLVVETTNLNPMHTLQGGAVPTEHTKVTERFRRVDENNIVYEFTVEDPTTYAEAWGGEIPFRKFDQLLYEYACHEGNYSLAAVLSGARFEERAQLVR